MAMAGAIATARGFLHWLGPAQPLTVLFIDGEMARDLKSVCMSTHRWTDLGPSGPNRRPEAINISSREPARFGAPERQTDRPAEFFIQAASCECDERALPPPTIQSQ
jgi:hypothetical protein